MKAIKDNKEIVYIDETCPLCNGKLYVYNYPEDDITDGVYCEHNDDDQCPYFRNQFLSYEDIC